MAPQVRTEVLNPRPMSARAGIGLRAPHHVEVRETRPDVGWLEVHSENHFLPVGVAHAALDAVRANYPISLHGVGLSLGSAEGLDPAHLERIRKVAERGPRAVGRKVIGRLHGRF